MKKKTINEPSVARLQQKNSNNFPKLTGNIIPSHWYRKFTNSRGTPDLALISVLSEILYWYRPQKQQNFDLKEEGGQKKFEGEAWQTSYSYFEKKFLFSREKLRRVFVKLEELKIIRREFRSVIIRGQEYNNRLFIHLDREILNFHNDISKKALSKLVEKDHVNQKDFFIPKEEGGSPYFEGNNKDNKNKLLLNRSTAKLKSNFFKKIIKDKTEKPNFHIKSFSSAEVEIKPKPLKAFYPLTETDCSKLQNLSGREFSLRAMNEILLDMSEKLKDRWFKSKRNFLSYMSQAFKHEKRDAARVSNENFRIKNNLKIVDEKLQKEVAQDLELKKQEQYLSEIEYSQQVSPEWHLKKKIAAILERDKAYNFLSSLVSSRFKENKFIFTLSKYVNLSQMDRQILLEQVKATQERVDFAREVYKAIDQVEIIMPGQERVGQRPEEGITNLTLEKKDNPEKKPDNLWSRIRREIKSFYGPKGEVVDKNWFSKLESSIDKNSKLVTLKAPTSFIRDWIEREYGQIIKYFFEGISYKCQIL